MARQSVHRCWRKSSRATEYFWPRPSAVDFATVASGASNLGLTSAKLNEQVAERAAKLREAHHLSADARLALDMIYTSGSGLDPHISPEAARSQVARVAKARNLDENRVTELLDRSTEGPQLTVLGEPRVNVLKLNLDAGCHVISSCRAERAEET